MCHKVLQSDQPACCQLQPVCDVRQKTVDQKTYCPCYNSTKRVVGGKGRGFWCGSCLYIRMGENIHEVRQRRDWRCPCCRDICNCSGANCLRARRNLAVTNQLIHEATKQGFKSVGTRVLVQVPFMVWVAQNWPTKLSGTPALIYKLLGEGPTL